MKFTGIISVALASLFLSGCPYTTNIKPGEASYSGAEERAILSYQTTPVGLGVVVPASIRCAEPSPDIAKATQNALSAALKVKGQEGSVSYSSAEAIASLVERTATIQLLRDYMFRACEGVANGMMTSTSYSLLMSRTNKAMITLMLGETAGGAFGRKGAAIGGKSSSTLNTAIGGLTESFEEQLEKLRELDLKHSEKNTELTTVSEELAALQAEKKEKPETTDKDNSKENELKEQKAELEKNIKNLEIDKANALAAVQSKQSENLLATAEIVKVQGTGGLTPNITNSVARILGDMQEIFVRDSLADEYVSACIVDMGMRTKNEVALGKARILNTKGKLEAQDLSVFQTILTEHCFEHLRAVVDSAEENRQAHLKRQDDNAIFQSKASILQGCNALKNSDNKKACLGWAGLEVTVEKLETKPNDINLIELKISSKIEKSWTKLKDKVEKISELDAKVSAITDTDENSKQKKALLDKSAEIKAEYKKVEEGEYDPYEKTSVPSLIEASKKFLKDVVVKLQAGLNEKQKESLSLKHKLLSLRLETTGDVINKLNNDVDAHISSVATFIQKDIEKKKADEN